MRKLAVMALKGGVGKTTTAVNLATCLALKKRRVLLIDADPQAHATIHMGINPYELESTLYDVLIHSRSVNEVIVPTGIEGLEIVPSHIDLSAAEIELVSHIGRENVLRDVISGMEKQYDYLLIDCPPSLGILTINALNAVTEIIIPIQAEFFALEGTSKLMRTIEVVRERLNPNLRIYKVLVTIYDGRKNICKDVDQKIHEHFKEKVFKTRIRDNVKLSEAPSYGKPVVIYSPSSIGSKDYINLTKEVLADE